MICFGLLIAASTVQAQESGPVVLRIPASARAAALGDAFAGARGSEMVFYNPAQIGVATGLSFTVGRYRSAATAASFATASTVGALTIAAGVQWLDYGSSGAFPTPPGDLTLEGETAQSLAATAAASMRIIGVRWGIAAKYLEERVPGMTPSSAAFDVGAAREFSRFTVALAAQNLGGDLGSAELPRRLVVGAAAPRWPFSTWFDLTAVASLSWEREERLMPAGAVELTYVPLEGFVFAARAGARRVEGGTRTRRPYTAGLGFSFDRLSLDYAYEPYSGPGGAHRFGLRIQ